VSDLRVSDAPIDWSDEEVRQRECARERITQLNEIQPHGGLLVIDAADGRLLHFSLSALALLRVRNLAPGAPLVGQIDDGWAGPIVELARRAADDGSAEIDLHGDDGPFDVTATRSPADPDGRTVLIEIEPASDAATSLFPTLRRALDRVAAATSLPELYEAAVDEIARLSGFDRTMIYAFHADGHGEVVAERRRPDQVPYLGLHFPASDIPAQARQLYRTKTCRHTADATADGSPVVPPIAAATGEPLQIGACDLRTVSAHHRQFMANMGTQASLSLSILSDGELIGLINCVHESARHVARPLRRACDIIAAQISITWTVVVQATDLARERTTRQVREHLSEQLATAADLAVELVNGDSTILHLVPADWAVARIGPGHSATEGGPTTAAVAEISRLATGLAPRQVWSTTQLRVDDPECASVLPEVAGLLVLSLGDGDFLAWLRRPVEQTVNWLGDQGPTNRPDPLSPRFSFELWRHTVGDRSENWPDHLDLADLADDLQTIQQRRREAAYAHLSWYDELTGLANRRMAVRELDHLLNQPRRGGTAVLFIDLDRFKSVNDTHGHHVGDMLLLEVARRLTAATRQHDTVSRFAGDEFVVICPGAALRDAERIAERIVESLRRPVQVDALTLQVTASVGIVDAHSQQRTRDVLQAADAAMYDAKRGGRDRFAIAALPEQRHRYEARDDVG
jgi:two-component system, chemotaxis family, sensor kinase Cph1